MPEPLQTIDIQSWMTLAGVLVGALLSLLGVLLVNRSSLSRLRLQLEYEHQKDQVQAKREKLEELYLLLGHWVNIFFGNYFQLTLVMKGEIDYNQYLFEITRSGEKNPIDYQRIEMIMSIYARELKPTYDYILTCREKVNDIAAAHKADYKNGNINGEKFIKPYTAIHTELESAIDKLRSEVAEAAVNA